LSIEDEDVIEVEKSIKKSPEFIEVKPAGVSKEVKKATEDDNLKEWEPVEDTQIEVVKDASPDFEEKQEEIHKGVSKPISKPVEKTDVETPSNYCHHCGAKLNGEGSFCGTCGQKLSAEEESKTAKVKGQNSQIETINKEQNEEMEWAPVEIEKTEEKIKEEEYVSTWEPIEEESQKEEAPKPEQEIKEPPVKETKLEEKPDEIQPEPEPEEETQILSFKDLDSIDQHTAKILYSNGITNIETLKITPIKELIKIKGIKRKKAKLIKKELEEISPIETIIEKEVNQHIEEPVQEEKALTWEPVEIEEPEKKEFIQIKEKKTKKKKKEKTLKKKTKVTKEPEKFELEEKIEEEKKEIPQKEEERDDVFKDINSIDDKISELLLGNNIDSLEKLNNITITELAKIKGIKRKKAKEIKKELKEHKFETVPDQPDTIQEKQIPVKEDVEEETGDEWEYFDEHRVSEESLNEVKGFRHKDYTLYEKKVEGPSGKVRTVRFFSKGEPDGAEPIELPRGYEVKVNKKTGVPYLRSKK
jgi:hypothetical protein